MAIDLQGPRIIVALDCARATDALALAARLDPTRCRLKVGKELFTAAGPPVVEGLQRAGFDVFLDLKFLDIPTTVMSACRAAAALGVWMLDVHASGGRAMMEAARGALSGVRRRPLLIAVTVLTSLDQGDLAEVGVDRPVQAQVLRLARLAAACELDGIVCAPADLGALRSELREPFLAVTPGIRPAAVGVDDQKRVATPARALADGASYLVIGRPITAAEDPATALAAIEAEIR